MKTLVTVLERLDTLQQEAMQFENLHYRVNLLTAIEDTRTYVVLNQGKFIKFINDNPLPKEDYISSQSVLNWNSQDGAILCLNKKYRMDCIIRCCESGLSIKEYETETQNKVRELDEYIDQMPKASPDMSI